MDKKDYRALWSRISKRTDKYHPAFHPDDEYEYDITFNPRYEEHKTTTGLRGTAEKYRYGDVNEIKTLFRAQFLRGDSPSRIMLIDPASIDLNTLVINTDYSEYGGTPLKIQQFNKDGAPAYNGNYGIIKTEHANAGYMEFVDATVNTLSGETEFDGAKALREITLTAKDMGLFNSLIDHPASMYTPQELGQISANINEAMRDLTAHINDEYMSKIILAERAFGKRIEDISDEDFRNFKSPAYETHLKNIDTQIETIEKLAELEAKGNLSHEEKKTRKTLEKAMETAFYDAIKYQQDHDIPEDFQLKNYELSPEETLERLKTLRAEVAHGIDGGYPENMIPPYRNFASVLDHLKDDPAAMRITTEASLRNQVTSLESQIRTNEKILEGAKNGQLALDPSMVDNKTLVKFCSIMVKTHMYHNSSFPFARDISHIEPEIQKYLCEYVGEDYEALKHHPKLMEKKVFDVFVRQNSECASAGWSTVGFEGEWDSVVNQIHRGLKGKTAEQKAHLEAAQKDLKVQLNFTKKLEEFVRINPNDELLKGLGEQSRMDAALKVFMPENVQGFMKTDPQAYELISQSMKKLTEEMISVDKSERKTYEALYDSLKELRDSHPFNETNLAVRDTDKVLMTVRNSETTLSAALQKELSKYTNEKMTVTKMMKLGHEENIKKAEKAYGDAQNALMVFCTEKINDSTITEKNIVSQLEDHIKSGHTADHVASHIFESISDEDRLKFKHFYTEYETAYKSKMLAETCKNAVETENITVRFNPDEARVLTRIFDEPIKDEGGRITYIKYSKSDKNEVKDMLTVKTRMEIDREAQAEMNRLRDPQVLAAEILRLRKIKESYAEHKMMEFQSEGSDKPIKIRIDSNYMKELDETINKMQTALDRHLETHHLFMAAEENQLKTIMGEIYDAHTKEVLQDTSFYNNRLRDQPQTKEYYEFKAFLAQEAQTYKIPNEYINTIAETVARNGYTIPDKDEIDRALKISLNLSKEEGSEAKIQEILTKASSREVFAGEEKYLKHLENVEKQLNLIKQIKEINEKPTKTEEDLALRADLEKQMTENFKKAVKFQKENDIHGLYRLEKYNAPAEEVVQEIERIRYDLIGKIKSQEMLATYSVDPEFINETPKETKEIDMASKIYEVIDSHNIILTNMDIEALMEEASRFYDDKLMEAYKNEAPKEEIEAIKAEKETVRTVLEPMLTEDAQKTKEAREKEEKIQNDFDSAFSKYKEMVINHDDADYFKKAMCYIAANKGEYPKEMTEEEKEILDALRNRKSAPGIGEEKFAKLLTHALDNDEFMRQYSVVVQPSIPEDKKQQAEYFKNELERLSHSKSIDAKKEYTNIMKLQKECEKLNIQKKSFEIRIENLEDQKQKLEEIKKGLTDSAKEGVDKIIKSIDKDINTLNQRIDGIDKEFNETLAKHGQNIEAFTEEDLKLMKEYMLRKYSFITNENAKIDTTLGNETLNQYGEKLVSIGILDDRITDRIMNSMTEKEREEFLKSLDDQYANKDDETVKLIESEARRILESKTEEQLIDKCFNTEISEEVRQELADVLKQISRGEPLETTPFPELNMNNDEYKEFIINITNSMIKEGYITSPEQFKEFINAAYGSPDLVYTQIASNKPITEDQKQMEMDRCEIIEKIASTHENLIIKDEDGRIDLLKGETPLEFKATINGATVDHLQENEENNAQDNGQENDAEHIENGSESQSKDQTSTIEDADVVVNLNNTSQDKNKDPETEKSKDEGQEL